MTKSHFLLPLILFVLGTNYAHGAQVTYTMSGPANNITVSAEGTAPANSVATYTQTHETRGTMTASNSATLTLSGYAYHKITGITLNMRSNKSAGAGTFSAKAGSTTLAEIATYTTFSKWYDNTTYSDSFKDIHVTMLNGTYEIQPNEDVVITISASVNSLYINSYTITYQPVQRTPTSITLSEQGNAASPEGTFFIGDPYTLPIQATPCDGKTFVGWSRTPVSMLERPTTDYYPKGTTIELTTDNTFYAVYATEIQGGGTTTTSIDFSAQGYTNGTPISLLTIDDATIRFGRGSGYSYPAYYVDGTAVRAYAGNTLKISSPYPIRRIQYHFGKNDGDNIITSSVGKWVSPTWTGKDTAVVFTIEGATGNRRIASMDITLENRNTLLGYSTTCEPTELPTARVIDATAGSIVIHHDISTSAPLTMVITKEDGTLLSEQTMPAPNADGLYTFHFGNNLLRPIPCQLLEMTILAEETPLAKMKYKVPLLIDSDTQIANFTYNHHLSRDICANCDIIIREDARLTYNTDTLPQFRHITIHPNGVLVVPNETALKLNRIEMHALNDDVSYLIFNPTNAEASFSVDTIVHVKQIDDQYWYPFSLPYDCNIKDICQPGGIPLGTYGTDWGIKYYDGQRRQKDGNSTVAAGDVSSYWTLMPEDGTLHAHQGYIIGLFTTDYANQLKSVLFTPATNKTYTETVDAQTTTIYNWTDNLSSSPRHHGWNFVGTPYISLFGGENTRQLHMNYKGDYRDNIETMSSVYLSIPDGKDSNTYTQRLGSATDILPFTAYFVQAIDPQNGSEQPLQLTYSKHTPAPPAAIASSSANHSTRTFIELLLTNADSTLSDNTGILIDSCYSSDYEIGADLIKLYAPARKPQLFTTTSDDCKMAYLAISNRELSESNHIPLGIYVPYAGDYTLSIDPTTSLFTNNTAVVLLHQGTIIADLTDKAYTFHAPSAGLVPDYALSIQSSATATNAIRTRNSLPVNLQYRQGLIMISELPANANIFIYDIIGNLIYSNHATIPQETSIPLTVAGEYNVIIMSEDSLYTTKLFVP